MSIRKKALIIGISGQDGAFLSQVLINEGYEVFGTSRDTESNNFQFLKALNIYSEISLLTMMPNNYEDVLNVIKKIYPEEIYNLSGQSSVGKSFIEPSLTFDSVINVALNCLEAIKKIDKKIKFYNSGSSECFGNTGSIGADENTLFNPESPYAIAKAAAHWTVHNYRKSYGLFAVSGILFNHESPFRSQKFVTQKIICSAIEISKGNQDFLELGNIDIQRDWGWAPEYVNAMFLMMQQDYADDFVIATGETNTLRDFVKITFDFFNLDWKNHIKISDDLIRPSDIQISCGNPTKARINLKWEAKVNLNQLIHKMIEAKLNN